MSGSPTLDLDMNLDSPSWNDDGGLVSVATNNVQLSSSTNAFTAEFSTNYALTREHDIESNRGPVRHNETDEGKEDDASNEEPKKNANLTEMMELVESWREEANMMSVKNAIVLDDLVKVGADI